jgi:VanZ family protein
VNKVVLFNLAHIPAFALLTLLWSKAINLNGKGSFSNLFVLSGLALFAVSTEFLQSFVPGHTASFMDFGLDLIGILSGFLIIRLFGKSNHSSYARCARTFILRKN